MGAKLQPGTGGNIYVPYEERAGNESIVYFTRDLSAQGLARAYEQVNGNIHGKVGLKLHTGEQHGPKILPRDWVKSLREKEAELQDSHAVETNTYYEGDAIRPSSTERRLRSMAGRSALSTLWMRTAWQSCRSEAANGLMRSASATTC